jgi:hypothetical protein
LTRQAVDERFRAKAKFSRTFHLEEDEMRATETQSNKSKRVFLTTVVLALLLPLCAGAGEKKWKEALLIAGPVNAKDNSLGEAGKTEMRTKNWVYVVKVGDYSTSAT